MSTFGGDAWGPYNVNNRRVVSAAQLLTEISDLRIQRQNTILRSIDDGEAKRLSNGQWACMVCPSRPVMDTPEMLAVHRNGKKHLAHYENYMIEHNIVDKKRRREDDDEYENETDNNKNIPEPDPGPMMVPRVLKRQKIINNDGNIDSKAVNTNRTGFGQAPNQSTRGSKPPTRPNDNNNSNSNINSNSNSKIIQTSNSEPNQ